MDRYPDMSGALPLHGPSGPLLAAAIASPIAKSLTQLGEDAGLSKFAASRAGRQLQEAGLLIPDARGYRFDDTHPLAELAQTVVWTLIGVKRRPEQTMGFPEHPEDDHSYQRDLPADLRLPGPPLEQRAESEISTVQARLVLGELAALMQRVLEPEELSQAIYAQWSVQRARDFVHQTLHLGTASSAAQATLAAELTTRVTPVRERVTVWTWSRAAALVQAEQRQLERTADLLTKAVAFAGPFQARREQLIDAAQRIARRRKLDDDQLQEITARSIEVDDLWQDSLGKFHGIGGFTAPRDMGTLGDQVMATILRQLAARYADLAQRMTAMFSAVPNLAERKDTEPVQS